MLDLSGSEKDRQRFWHLKDYIWQLGRYAVVLIEMAGGKGCRRFKY
jgi:hypothetical protein